MKAEPKRLWLEALRSGEYKQGQYYMRNGGTYCCLGVLQEVAQKAGVVFTPDWGSTSFIPSPVGKWIGIDFQKGEDLAAMNDSGESFNQIADYIEREISTEG